MFSLAGAVRAFGSLNWLESAAIDAVSLIVLQGAGIMIVSCNYL